MTDLRRILVASLALSTGCAAIRGTEPPGANANLAVATQYWFRGVPQSEEPVAQGDATITAPLENGDSLAVSTWGNYQLSNSAGDAALAGHNGGDFTELDVTGLYTTRVDDVTVFGGVISYNFPNEVGKSTTELLGGVTLESESQVFTHAFTLYFDIDQAEDFYLTYGLSHTNRLDDAFTADFSGLIGLMGEGQAELYYGTEHAGLSDASLTGRLAYRYDEFTTIYAKATAIAVLDEDLRDAEDDRDFRTSTVVFTVGFGWSL